MKKENILADGLFAPEAKKTRRGWLRPAVLALLLVAAGIVWYLGGKETVPEQAANRTPSPKTTAAPVPQTARQRREAAYEKDLAAVQALAEQPGLPEETRRQAAEQAAQMIREHQTELGLEEALTNAGFTPCFVLMQNDALTIAVSASEITAAQSAVILSLCLEHAQVASENIRIMPGVL